MKVLSIILVFFVNTISCSTRQSMGMERTHVNSKEQTKSVSSIRNVPLDIQIDSIEYKINTAFNDAVRKEDASALIKLIDMLKLHKDSSTYNSDTAYWLSYSNYQLVIFYSIQAEDEKSEYLCKKIIEELQDLKDKTSEHYALLAHVKSFSLQYKSGMAAAFGAQKSSNYVAKSLKKNENNLRAWLVKGINDFYTPKTFGGGKKTMEYLSKALSCPDKLDDGSSTNGPTWGRDSVYEYIIMHYIEEGDLGNAKLFFKEAIEIYPEHYVINSLAKELVE